MVDQLVSLADCRSAARIRYREVAVQALHGMIAGQHDRVITARAAEEWLERLVLEPRSGASLHCEVIDHEGYLRRSPGS
ncbi:hypothetical protein ACFOSC_20455 [Streptantibioticus rubrisoli]|uniref:Uncharacterized protein n=1 Tax=Streptantibioticus rubrisoli TaxID=1387313 RepID=A0ABT1PH95_9ACTN|nr:hypothetical protein [Streptantibioticus rubrisoli]MCQ4044738.1 hypothetical protein [Streptantibioticus rubrisoli]